MALITLPNGRQINVPGGGIMSPAMRDKLGVPTAAPTQSTSTPMWRPSYFNQPQTPYPENPYAPSTGGGGGGRGGGGGGYRGGASYSGPLISVPPEMAYGSGSYWPGHSAEFQAQQQAAILGILAGRQQADTRQPAQLAAEAAMNQARGFTVGPGGMRIYNRGGGGRGLAGGYQNAYDMAQQANEARYADILSGFQARRDANAGAGAQEARDINTAWDASAAARRQALIGRGLGNSTVLDTQMQGNERERQDSLGRLNERLRREEAGLTADQLAFMERRTDEGPDMNQAIALAQGLGAAGSQAPRVVGTQVVPTMGGVGYTGGWLPSGYAMPVRVAGGGFAGQATSGRAPVWGGQTAQQIRALNQRMADQGGMSGGQWAKVLETRAAANAENQRIARAGLMAQYNSMPFGGRLNIPGASYHYVKSYGGPVKMQN